MNIDKRTAILYEGFEILRSIAEHCFEEPYTPNEKRAWILINEFEKLQYECD